MLPALTLAADFLRKILHEVPLQSPRLLKPENNSPTLFLGFNVLKICSRKEVGADHFQTIAS
jgi:hypothetical protein